MQREFQPTVYLLANRRNGAIYTGVTSNLLQRIQQHRDGLIPGFTKEHAIKRLVWFEQHATMERDNLGWRDLAEDFGFDRLGPTGSPLSRG